MNEVGARGKTFVVHLSCTSVWNTPLPEPYREDRLSEASRVGPVYYKRFHAHLQAQDFAKKSLKEKETEQRMVRLQEQNSDTVWTDVEFLKVANEQVVECRRVLKYTYVYGFYLHDDEDEEERQRFEHNQGMLEGFTENLSKLD